MALNNIHQGEGVMSRNVFMALDTSFTRPVEELTENVFMTLHTYSGGQLKHCQGIYSWHYTHIHQAGEGIVGESIHDIRYILSMVVESLSGNVFMALDTYSLGRWRHCQECIHGIRYILTRAVEALSGMYSCH